jgi:hypothetical protein
MCICLYEAIIENYFRECNRLNPSGMLEDLDKNIKFEVFSGNRSTLLLNGINEFKIYAGTTAKCFSHRHHKILCVKFGNNTLEVDTHCTVTLAKDMPNGEKAQTTHSLQQTTVFKFKRDTITEIKYII